MKRNKKILVFSLVMAMILTLLPVLPAQSGVMAAQDEILLSENETAMPEEEEMLLTESADEENESDAEFLLSEEEVLPSDEAVELLEDAAIEIDSEDALIAFAGRVNAGERDLNAVLTADIALTAAWNPIKPDSGYITEAYSGTFDGAGHRITGLSVSGTTAAQGLFGQIDGAVIKDLIVEGSVSSTKANVGGIVGQVRTGRIENCSFSGTVSTSMTTTSGYVGGIAGNMGTAQSSVITGCVNNAAVTGGCAGGIAGYAKYCTITDCYNTGTITGAGRSGGITGQSQNNVALANCYNIGSIEGNSSTKADIVDFLYSSASITNCYYLNAANGAGTGIVNGGGVINKDTLADDLGSAFTEDADGINDGYAILAWQAGGAVIPKDPKIVITGQTALYCSNNDSQPEGTLTVNFIDMDAALITWTVLEGDDVIAVSEPAEHDDNHAVMNITGLKPGTATVKAATADQAYEAETEISVYPFITGLSLKDPAVAGQPYQPDITVYGGGVYDFESYPVLNTFTWRYFDSRSDYTSNPSGGTVIPGTGHQIVIPEELVGKWLTVTLNNYQGQNITPSTPYGVDIKSNIVPVTSVTIEGAAESGTILTTKSGTLLKALAFGGDGREATNVSYQWQKYEEEWDDYWEEWEYIWTPIEGATEQTFQVPDDKTAIDAQYRVVVSGEESSTVTSRIIKVTELSDHLKAAEDADAVTVNGAEKITETGTLELAQTGANGSVITWQSSDESYITTDGTILRLPEEGTLEVTLTATAVCGQESASKEILCTLYSAAAAEDDAVLTEALSKYAYGTLAPVFGTDTNIAAYLEADLVKKGYDGISVEVTGVSVRSAQSNGTVDIAENGDITYFYDEPFELGSFGKRTYGQFDVQFVLTKGSASANLSKVVNVYWDVDRLCAALQSQLLDQLTFDEIKADNDAIDNVKTDLTLPQYLGGKEGGKTLAKISWTTSDPNVISIKESTGSIDEQIYGPHTGVVKQGMKDQTVILTATISYSKLNSGSAVEEEAVAALKQEFEITVPSLDAEVILADMQAKLDAGVTLEKLTYSANGETIDPEAVIGDIQLVTPKNTGIEGYSDYKFTYSSEDDAIGINGYRANVFRPLPEEEDADAVIIVTMTRKDNENLSVQKALPLKIKALSQEELDQAAELMDKIAAAYWDGIKGENTDKNNITADLRAFQEINLDEEGNVSFVYNVDDMTNAGVIPVTYVENPDGSSDEAYTKFHSSRPDIIQSGFPRLLGQPEYDTVVIVESYLSHEIFGDYYEKYRDADPDKAAVFAKFYRQRAAATMVVKGEKGEDPDPDAKIAVTFEIRGAGEESWLAELPVTADKNSMLGDVLEKVFSDNGILFTGSMDYIRSITLPDGRTLAEKDRGENSGWMYRVNGVLPDKKISEYVLEDQDKVLLFFTDDYTQEPKELVKLISISIKKAPELATKTSYQLKVVYDPANTSETDLVWTSSNPEIASVDAKGNVQAKTYGTATITATSPTNPEITATCKIQTRYYDATKSNVDTEMFKAIYWAADAKITGMPVYFGTNDSMTRGQFVRFLYRYAGNPKVTSAMIKKYGAQFKDVDSSYTHYKAIVWAVSKGLIGGYSDGTFKPEKSLSRNNVATILWKFGGSKKVSSAANPFKDVKKSMALAWGKSKGIFKADADGNFKPSENCIRGDFAVFLYRYDKKK